MKKSNLIKFGTVVDMFLECTFIFLSLLTIIILVLGIKEVGLKGNFLLFIIVSWIILMCVSQLHSSYINIKKKLHSIKYMNNTDEFSKKLKELES